MIEVNAPVTMSDVARAAGVSTATVSRVVNGHYGVSARTVAQVRSAIEQLGYESSLVATSLRRSRTNVLGLVTHSFQSYTAEVLKGVMKALSRSGFDLIIYANSDLYGSYSEGWEQRHLTRLSGTLTDGCIVVTPWGDVRSRTPVVAIDPVRGSTVPSVTADNLAGATTAVEHLLGLGHRRIGFIAGRASLAAGLVAGGGLPGRAGRRRCPGRPDADRQRGFQPRVGGAAGTRPAATAGPADGDLRGERRDGPQGSGGRQGTGALACRGTCRSSDSTTSRSRR